MAKDDRAPLAEAGVSGSVPEISVPAATRQVRYDDLYMRWEAGAWSAGTIDLGQDVVDWRERLTPEQRRAATWLFSLFFHGEDAVATHLAAYIAAAPSEEHRYFLATQQADEARHSVLFKRLLHEVAGFGDGTAGGGKLITEDQLTWGHRELFARLDSMADELWRDPSPPRFAAAVMLYHVVIEGSIAQPGMHLIERAFEHLDIMPATRQALGLVAVDEQRHIAFGVRAIADLLEEHGKPVQDRMTELLREILPWTAGVARPPGDDHDFTASLGFSIDDLYEESGQAFEARLLATGMPADKIARFPLPMDLSARDRGTRALRMLEAQLIGPKDKPFIYDREALAMLFDAMRRQADHTQLPAGTVVRWDFTDANPWELRFGAHAVEAMPGSDGQANLTLSSSLEDFVDLSAGRQTLGSLLLRRRMRLRGQPVVLMRLGRVFA